MPRKIRVGLIFGGKSAEHEVSVSSARNVYEALDKSKYEVVLLGIDQNGAWHLNDAKKFLLESPGPSTVDNTSTKNDVIVLPNKAAGELVSASSGEALGNVDVVFPILHGTNGEDGTVQGLLKLANVPFVGPGVLGSAVAMDKDVAKRLMRDSGIPVVPFDVVSLSNRASFDFAGAASRLGLPLFVKPANLGSSVGIRKAKSLDELKQAVDFAFQFDRKVLVESFIPCREIECAVLGNDQPEASVVGEIIHGSQHEFYSYEAKYIDNEGQRIEIPANLPAEVCTKIRELAVRTFLALGCEGMARVDFFVTKEWQIYVNEVNTIPGFTNISMYPMLWKASGVSYPKLIDRLIELALARHQQEAALQTSRS